jgi:Fur family peroxide stress response transcriptional regulator
MPGDGGARLDELYAKMRREGKRLTPQRLAILRILATSDAHPTVQEVYDEVRVDFPTTSLATVYATVSTLEQMDEVLTLAFGDGSNHYDCRTPRPHPHVVCLECGSIADVELPAFEDASDRVADRTGYQVVRQRLDFFGFCPQCQQHTVTPLAEEADLVTKHEGA